MSGRLRILPHKSWHVWTTDNIEKVKRDERIHREEIEKSSKKSRDIKSEQLLSQLLNNSARNDKDCDVIPDDTQIEEDSIPPRPALIKCTPINRHSDNLEYKKEKMQKEKQQKRVEGSAPFQLVPDEFKRHNAPWYLSKRAHVKTGSGYHEGDLTLSEESCSHHLERERQKHHVLSSLFQPPSTTSSSPSSAGLSSAVTVAGSAPPVMIRGRRLEGQEAAAFQDRDLCRKGAADPMARYLKAASSFCESQELGLEGSHHKKRKKHHSESKQERDSMKVGDCSLESVVNDDSHKEQRKKKHKKHKKISHPGDSRRDRHRQKGSERSSDEGGDGVRPQLDQATLLTLRQRRLERERDAKLKTDLHIAQQR